jgi:hypothetical protein
LCYDLLHGRIWVEDNRATQHLGAHADSVTARIRVAVGNVVPIAATALYCSIAHDHCHITNHDVGQALVPFDQYVRASHHAIYERRVIQTISLTPKFAFKIPVKHHRARKRAAYDARGTCVKGEESAFGSDQDLPPIFCNVAVSLEVIDFGL